MAGITLHAIVGLAAIAGLRIGEVVALDRKDVDLETGNLLLSQSKFGRYCQELWIPFLIQAALLFKFSSMPSTNFPSLHQASYESGCFNSVATEGWPCRVACKPSAALWTGEPAPFVTRCLRRTVANADSIGLVVRMWSQCSAGKS